MIRSGEVLIDPSPMTAYWKSRPRCRALRSNIGFPERSMNASGPSSQGQHYVSQRSWVDIVCWHDVLPKLVMRVEPDEKFINALDRELQIFKCFIERVMEKIRVATKGPVPQGGIALKAALRASLEVAP